METIVCFLCVLIVIHVYRKDTQYVLSVSRMILRFSVMIMNKTQRIKFTEVEKNGQIHMLSIVANDDNCNDLVINFDGMPIIYTSISDIIRRYQDEVGKIEHE